MNFPVVLLLIALLVLLYFFFQKHTAFKRALIWNGEATDLENKILSLKNDLIALQKEKLVLEKDIFEKTSFESEKLLEISSLMADLDKANCRLNNEKQKIELASDELQSLQARISHILELEQNVESLKRENSFFEARNLVLEKEIKTKKDYIQEHTNEIDALLKRIDLYSRVDELTSVGHFETPDYLYSTPQRYNVEISNVRNNLRDLITTRRAITYPDDLLLCVDSTLNKRVLDGQIKLLLSSFNIECGFLIEKVSPSNFGRTLEQIERLAERLESSCASLKCGFSLDYIKLKLKECSLVYEYKLKQQEVEMEQSLLKEKIKEEVRIRKQCEEAILEAEKEELRLRKFIEKAREELLQATEIDKALAQAKISLLETQLAEAEEKGRRAKSLAEQTRAGYVYIISNIGSFGEGVYKIGLTRRADPNERVDELSGASVPFPFDIHAKILTDDAPGLEYKLHQRFKDRRVNAVNIRKEFFRVSLQEIQFAIEEILGKEVDFIMTAKADDYYGSRRLLPSSQSPADISQNLPIAN